jgi:hypothetical protein
MNKSFCITFSYSGSLKTYLMIDLIILKKSKQQHPISYKFLMKECHIILWRTKRTRLTNQNQNFIQIFLPQPMARNVWTESVSLITFIIPVATFLPLPVVGVKWVTYLCDVPQTTVIWSFFLILPFTEAVLQIFPSKSSLMNSFCSASCFSAASRRIFFLTLSMPLLKRS